MTILPWLVVVAGGRGWWSWLVVSGWWSWLMVSSWWSVADGQ
jgi:hypothetical protein